MSILPQTDSIDTREVWNDNLEAEFAVIREIVDDFPYVAMDTEFPGTVIRVFGTSYDDYWTLKANVDHLKLIQLGLTFSDEDGKLPIFSDENGEDKFCIWQFNFREFTLEDDIFAPDSIKLLGKSGIDFEKNRERGIDASRFAELLLSSGIVLNDAVHWVTFHSRYDFGYLLKLLTCQNLPDTQAGFFDLFKMYFPMVYDIKHLMQFCDDLKGEAGLNKLANKLKVKRVVGESHQAGSDSLLTSSTFRKLKESFVNGSIERYAGVLYGLGVENGRAD